MRNHFLVIILLPLTIILTNCSYGPDYDQPQEITLDYLKNVNSDSLSDTANTNSNSTGKGTTIRQVALHEMALSMGMRGSLYARSKEINQFLSANSNNLDKIFNFNSLMLSDNVIPPVLIEAIKTVDAKAHEPLPSDDDVFLLNDNPSGQALAKAKIKVDRAQNNFRTLRITDRVYKIMRQARFAVAVPGWRDYLQLNYTQPNLPEGVILPKDSYEQEIWAKGVEEGWKLGNLQAEQILAQNLMLLRRDYLGMVRYKKLLTMKMVSAPFVAKRNYGVTGDGNEIKIHDQILTIAALPALKPDSRAWSAFVTQDQEAELDAKIASLNLDQIIAVKDKSNQPINYIK
ncbi:MAG: type IV secretory system conjugative DNA transfer family protein [Gammaproteobacteria bacterium]|nr:type IV secretory system conjugative DNA transfer family protein [Gammaproteobacteria bacterium]